jgi:hypothetical protein
MAASPQLIADNAVSGPAEDLRDLKPPVEIIDPWFWVVLIAICLALAVLGWWLWKRRAARSIPVPVRAIPAHEQARRRLCEALKLIDQPRPFCIAVSDTVRLYLEERFQWHAPERTTEEFLEEMQSSQELTPDQKQTLGEFLAQCDLVKFARLEPSRTELDGIYNSALRLVEETEPPAPNPLAREAGPDREATRPGP